MALGLGLGWSPAVFWESTVYELFRAIEGHNKFNGGGGSRMTNGKAKRLKSFLAEMKKKGLA